VPPTTHEKAPGPVPARAAEATPSQLDLERATSAQLSDDDRAFRASLDGLIDFYRVEQGSSLWRAFWPPALIFLPLGSVLTAVAMTDRWVHGPLQPYMIVLALLVTATGPLWAIVRLLRSIRSEDRYVAIFEEGLRICLDGPDELRRIPWQELLEVQCDGSQLRLVLAAGELPIKNRFAELSLAGLAARIRHARRLALWGRLSRQSLASQEA
jgi:hypothetical protein